MTSYQSLAYEAERQLQNSAAQARRYIEMLGSRAVLVEAALTVLVKHNLMDEFVKEHAEMRARTLPVEDRKE